MISFNQFILPSAASPGVNAFDIFNATGPFAIPPSFPVVASVDLTDVTLTLAGQSGTQTILIGTIAPGPLLDSNGLPLASLQFPGNSQFTSATLSGSLDVTLLILANGSKVQVAESFSTTLTPSSGTFLVAGTDFAPIDVNPVPEPSTLVLYTSALVAMCLALRLRTATG